MNQFIDNQEEDDFVSKTQLKNQAKELKKFGLKLTELSDEKLKSLPIDDVTLKSLLDYKIITSNLARKRHLMFIGKCLRNEDQQAIESVLSNELNSNLKQKVQISPIDNLADSLIENTEETINEILLDKPQLERQKLRQLSRNTINAKNEQKKLQSFKKLKAYLQEFY